MLRIKRLSRHFGSVRAGDTVDLEIPDLLLERVESRASVYFDFGAAPLAYQWSYRLRQLLLQHVGEGA